MALRLKTRVKPIPNGLRFSQPEINWNSVNAVGKYPSWETLVNAVIAARNANPHHRDKNHWATDPEFVAEEVDAYNTKICVENGWMNFLQGDDGRSPPPKPSLPSSLLRSAGNVAAGSRVLVNWITSGAEAVPIKVAEDRAAVCSRCPLNVSGDMTSFFTIPVANAIRAALNQRDGWNLKTSLDDRLGVCDACSCPLKLKVWMTIDRIVSGISQEQKDALHNGCWIKSEGGL